ncbi:hypothetical protein ABIC83_002533 [Roseateles asaccharophilus]|uniref:hypothetical protein n=1 Tax=Roseateles asaccharophilus TaxID=582607 RepID=UPI0038385D8D
MSVFDTAREELGELIRLVRASERYCVQVHHTPSLATDESHAAEVQREYRIVELKEKYGIKD